VRSHGVRADLAILATTLDTLIAILVKIGKVLPEFLVSGMDNISILGSQGADGGNVEFVLVGLGETLLVQLNARK
jgi:hypothetical protein